MENSTPRNNLKKLHQVTLANWRTPPYNTWAFHHVREIVPSADVANNPEFVWKLGSTPLNWLERHITLENGSRVSFQEFLDTTHSDGLVVLHRGQVVCETYANGLNATTPHILMSVSKSLLGLLAGILAGQGVLDPDALVTAYVPELADTSYVGATLRNLLDMQAGILFNEDYLATDGPIIEYRKATNWNPLSSGETASDLRSFFQSLTASDGEHGTRFHYVSPNTDLLAWVIERATGQRFSDLMSTLLWQPMGAERSGYITVDRLGAHRAAGGFCAVTRDLARVGQLMVQDGRRGNHQIIPRSWLRDIVYGGNTDAWDEGTFAAFYPGRPMRYRSHWYVVNDDAPLIFGLGIHGQNLFVDRSHAMVIAKVSSQPRPLDPRQISLTMRAVAAIRSWLVEKES